MPTGLDTPSSSFAAAVVVLEGTALTTRMSRRAHDAESFAALMLSPPAALILAKTAALTTQISQDPESRPL
jgi:hypothetical protein